MKWNDKLSSIKGKVRGTKILQTVGTISRKIKGSLKRLIKNKKLFIGIKIAIGGLSILYIVGVVYFTSHFYWGTQINGIKVGGSSLEKAIIKVEAMSNHYILELRERHGQLELIKGSDIDLFYQMSNGITEVKENQSSWSWPWHIFEATNLKVTKEISYNPQLLQDKVNTLTCLTNQYIRKPVDASIKYIDGSYQIIEGDKGNTVDSIALNMAISKAIKAEDKILDLDKESCYKKALYNKESKKLIDLKDELNYYLKAQITYDFGDKQEVIDQTQISSWLSVNEQMQVVVDEEAIADYIIGLAYSYDTLGQERYFTTSTGKRVKVTGGDYGWKLNVQDEIGEVIELIKQGNPVKRVPIYTQSALKPGKNDIGSTYVEINLSRQYIWFYKEGKLVVKSDVVTGNLKKHYDTPEGTYTLDYKSANVVLRGPGYAVPVKYWMPFNGGIGLHDASWRNTFGSEIYRTNGSHGCVNLPTKVAEDIFANIESGIPVICYFED
ncbi:L,D-transpeptidase family protein [Cellulosilyticum sp. WCF-2]|uniref:L,D-transpeptidase family protein n=1 Tax=Cellulosilyticum sp. WCF-2 TaxID=2497860 RepID=UPI000F8EB6D8|nr:L,D-transpeptidase family protein [Cellulosilyticum sp. WCF-2]QEH67052.1 L,D-transpeptidase family protein [Cellulosilyticum sp. WCF-2]